MKKLFFIILFSCLTLLSYSKSYEYVCKINNKVTKFIWEITEKQDFILFFHKTPHTRETIKSDKNTGTLSWYFEDKLGQIILKAEKIKKLNKEFIKLTGIIKANKIEKEYELNDVRWIQNIAVETKKFILSENKEMDFITIRKSDGEFVPMKIEKKEVQQRKILKKVIQVIRAEVKENIFLSDVSLDYWFRKKDGLCIAFTDYDNTAGKNKIIIKLASEN